MISLMAAREHFRQTIERVRELNPGIIIEVLVPDFFDRDEFAIHFALRANPHIYNHNLENRPACLTPRSRHRATYDRSLNVLRKVKEWRGDFHSHQIRGHARTR